MKPVFKCDYCNFMGDETQVKEHELTCFDNYDRKSCYTCAHKTTKCSRNVEKDKAMWIYECKRGIEIPEGKIYEFCGGYERKEPTKYSDLGNIFESFFGR